MSATKYEWITIDEQQDETFNVYGYAKAPRHSVLAGQTLRHFVDAFYTLEEAQAKYPDAELNTYYRPHVSLNHLSDDSDY